MTVTALAAMPAPPDLSHTPWRIIWLSEKHEVWCLVDAVDHAWLSETTWNISWGSRTPWQAYAKRNVGVSRAAVRMHREIMLRADPDGYRFGLVVDHINGQTLDNRRANLRWATQLQNGKNRRSRQNVPSLAVIVPELMTSLPVWPAAVNAEVPF